MYDFTSTTGLRVPSFRRQLFSYRSGNSDKVCTQCNAFENIRAFLTRE